MDPLPLTPWRHREPLSWTRAPELDGPGPAMKDALPGILEARAYRAELEDGTELRAWLAGEGRTDALYILEVEGSPEGDWPTLEVIHGAIEALAPNAAFSLLGLYLIGVEVAAGPSSVLLVQQGAVTGTDAHRRLELSNLGGSHGPRPRLTT